MDALLAALRRADGLLLVVTGAGVSAASGVPTFRGPEPDAVWTRYDMSLATAEALRDDPVAHWSWLLERFAAIDGAAPNAAHQALVELETWQERRGGRCLLVTQNIDGLHGRAGQRRLIEVHGSAARLRCTQWGCVHGAPRGSLPRRAADLAPFRRAPAVAHLPRCPACGAHLRAHVLLFDEYYDGHRDYRFAEVCAAAEEAALLLFAGTSFAVGITDLLLGTALRRATPMFTVDPHVAVPPVGARPLRAAAEELLPRLVGELAGSLGTP